jgi:hypothetical protein
MLVPLRSAYASFDGVPLYISPLAYLGYVHFPVLKKLWPQSAYEVKDTRKMIEILKKSCEVDEKK